MDFTLRLPLSLIRVQMNATLQKAREQFKGAISVIPQGEIQLHGEGETLISTFPVRIQATADWLGLARSVLGKLTLPALVTFDAQISFRTQLQVHGNWELKTQSVVDYQWIRNPSLNLGIKVPIKEVVAPLLRRELKRLGQQIDSWVPQMVNLKVILDEAWQQTQDLVPLEDDLFLRLIPEQDPIPVGPIQLDGRDLSVKAQLPLRGEVGTVGSLVPIPRQSLTEPTQLDAETTTTLPFCLHLPWKQLESDVSDQSIEEEMAGRKLQLSWRKVELAGEGLHLRLKTWFKVQGVPFAPYRRAAGQIELSWEWDLSPDGQAVGIKHLKAHISQAPNWLSASWWLIRYWVRKDLTEGITKQIQEQIRASRQEVEQLVADYALPTGAQLQGKIQKVAFEEMWGEKENLRIGLRLSGYANMVITEL